MDTITKILPVKLTKGELKQAGKDIALKFHELEDVKIQKKVTNASFKRKMDSISTELEDLSRMIEYEEKDSDVECQWRLNPKREVVELLRLDTMEVIDEREPVESDYQLNLLDDNETEEDTVDKVINDIKNEEVAEATEEQ